MKGPQDHGTTGPQDHKTVGPWDRGTAESSFSHSPILPFSYSPILPFPHPLTLPLPHAASLSLSCLGLRLALLAGLLVVLPGCLPDMWNDSRLKPFEESTFFRDGLLARRPVPGTVARGHLHEDDHLYTGKVEGKLAESFPFAVTRDVLTRGEEQYRIFCAPCHGLTGYGDGIIVKRGFPQPPSFHIDRLRSVPDGHYFDVMTNGFGRMFDYAERVKAEDRWAVTAYIRALQLSQHVDIRELEEEDRKTLKEMQE